MTSGLRARVRAEMTNEIKAAARKHLATDGANLSLRAVARDLGMVSSAIYRYFPSRDDLLTALIIDAYNDLGEATEQAEGSVERSDLTGRYTAVAHAIRNWARANPPEYALLYGSPVPGYAAPQSTIEPATRPVLVLMAILRDGVAAGVIAAAPALPPGSRMPKTTRADLKQVAALPDFAGIPETVLAQGIASWALLFGLISFELFGRLVNTINDYDAFYDYQVKAIAQGLGLG
ncbi:TetR/AcrR family transcriptional regulator [Jatrophihabitans sp. DSM 45814]